MTIHKDTLVHTPEGKVQIGTLFEYYGKKTPFRVFSVDVNHNLVEVMATVRDSPPLKRVVHFLGMTVSYNQQVVCHPNDPLQYTANPHGKWYTLYAKDSASRIISAFDRTTQLVGSIQVNDLDIDTTDLMRQMYCLTIPSTGIYLAGESAVLLGT